MKKVWLSLLGVVSIAMVKAQEPADALKLSWNVPGATARIKAIGGANASLGGDISSTFINPAGLGFYRTGDFVFTPQYHFDKTKATYTGRTEEDKNKRLTLGTTGFVIGSGGSQNIKSAAFSLAINRAADFNSNILYRGETNGSSYSQKFLEEIRNGGIRDANAVASNFPYGTSLGFNTYWIDTIAGGSSNNYQFQSRAPIGSGLLQQNTINTRGGINEFALGVAVNLKDKLMIGGSIGVPVIHYERDGEYVEADATENNTNKFNYAMFKDNLKTSGFGLNIKAGVIVKAADFWRLGFAIHSPTVFTVTDKYFASVTTDTEGYMGVQTQNSEDVSGATSEFKYDVITPYKLIGSVSYVLREVEDVTKQKGFLTADVEFVNYKAASFEPNEENNNDQGTRDYLASLNQAIDAAYKSAVNVKVGGELKFTTFMVRAGAAYFGNPYVNINGDKGSKLNLSGGLGYRNQGFFVDLTYVHAIGKDVNFPYRLQYSPYMGANVKSIRGNAMITIGFKI
jgi:hypothetical protein